MINQKLCFTSSQIRAKHFLNRFDMFFVCFHQIVCPNKKQVAVCCFSYGTATVYSKGKQKWRKLYNGTFFRSHGKNTF